MGKGHSSMVSFRNIMNMPLPVNDNAYHNIAKK